MSEEGPLCVGAGGGMKRWRFGVKDGDGETAGEGGGDPILKGAD